ncbi:stage III sporulation protein AD [Rubeoparvulum massiliense]|uniref:stage III sporulation protein AD n=1 Tax=Rubeoparvulum massiliense TaxID=1631346 RepID=UPI00065E4535|nr:stage III sporulation protein AD [Rubeoparvulum massiliense]
MEIIQIIGLGLTATLLVMVLQEHAPIIAYIIVLVTGIFIFFYLLDKISLVIQLLERIAIQANVNLIFLETILKIIGIAYIIEFAAQLTRDAGQSSIASKIELAGKITILVLAIPILSVIIDTILRLLP